MAKINTSAIEGYEAMSAEEKLAALEALDIPDVDKIKSALDKATSEAAGYKKQLRERMSEDEAKAQRDADERAAIMEELEQLRVQDILDTASYPPVRITVTMDELLDSATKQNFIPVVDDSGSFIGIVTRKDIIRHFAEGRSK